MRKRGSGSGLDPGFDLAKVLFRKIHICNLILLISQGENEIPIGTLNRSNGFGGSQPEIRVGLFQTLTGDR